MRRIDGIVFGTMAVVAVMMSVGSVYIVRQQQVALEVLLDTVAGNMEYDMDQQAKLWDLHRRVLALEDNDERLEAHIRWFVMRRSGTNELRKMEAAIRKLEEGNSD